jgi:ribosomal protein S18 acetylase RimI-like enzyme
MVIRKATKEDFKQLSVMYKEVFKVHNIFTKSIEEIEKYLEQFLGNLLVAEEDSKIVGGLAIVEKQYGDWKLFNFKHVGVLPEYQGKDIGSSLLKEAEKIAGTGKIEIRVSEVEGAIGFYEKNSYEKEAELKSHYRKGETCFIMGKVLQ